MRLCSLIGVAAIALSPVNSRAEILRDPVTGDKPRSCCMFNAAPEQLALLVDVDPPSGHESVRFVHFRLNVGIDLPDANFSVLWDLPNGAWIYDPVIRLARNGEELDVSEHFERDSVDPYLFNIALSDVSPGDSVSFSMGWQGAEFEAYEASLVVDRGVGKVAFFGGWRP